MLAPGFTGNKGNNKIGIVELLFGGGTAGPCAAAGRHCPAQAPGPLHSPLPYAGQRDISSFLLNLHTCFLQEHESQWFAVARYIKFETVVDPPDLTPVDMAAQVTGIDYIPVVNK